jgi:hypothetical protein
MGRYYFGTISGKFWVCIQDSDDASYFKSPIIFSTPLKCFEYMGCCCFVKDIYDLYCTKCYNSFEEHVESIEDEYLLEDIKRSNDLIYQNNYIKYYFENFELKYVKNKLNKLENYIGQDIINNIKLKIYDENNTQNDSDEESDEESGEESDEESDEESGEESDTLSDEESDTLSDDESDEESDEESDTLSDEESEEESYEDSDEEQNEPYIKEIEEESDKEKNIVSKNKKPSFTYDFNEKVLKGLDDNKKKLIAKWCLGKLIEYSLKKLGYCEIYCET